MTFRVAHTTTYTYSGPVFLDPHTFRLRPRVDGTQQVRSYALQIEPRPTGLTEALDQDGNAITNAWFEGATQQLVVAMRCEVATQRTNPFDFLPERQVLTPSSRTDLVARFAKDVAARSPGDVLAALCAAIHETCRSEIREEGEPHPPAYTLEHRTGSCRDFAVLFVDACHALGLNARFVSGYHAGQAVDHQLYLHAWAEVYVPGGGWRGFDPTQGLAVADRHLVIAASATPADAAPITGAYRGTGVKCQMNVALEIAAS